jgi:dCMP deaminase
MSDAVVAYVPVLHEGYRRFLERHARGRRLFLIGPELYADYRPLAKDVRALDAGDAATAIAAWGIADEVRVLDLDGALLLASESPSLILPAEDVSYQVVERFFPRCEVLYDSVFLRWDKSKSVQMLEPPGVPELPADAVLAELVGAAEAEAGRSVDWWRQVGAAMRLASGELISASNEHNPHALSAYAVGDPRSNFFKGVHLELSTATHAEAALIARAAREGKSTEGAQLYVTDFPCPPCAKLIAGAGVAKLMFRTGYAVLDGRDVLETAGVEMIQMAQSSRGGSPNSPNEPRSRSGSAARSGQRA